jgi:hypothetical protein
MVTRASALPATNSAADWAVQLGSLLLVALDVVDQRSDFTRATSIMVLSQTYYVEVEVDPSAALAQSSKGTPAAYGLTPPPPPRPTHTPSQLPTIPHVILACIRTCSVLSALPLPLLPVFGGALAALSLAPTACGMLRCADPRISAVVWLCAGRGRSASTLIMDIDTDASSSR